MTAAPTPVSNRSRCLNCGEAIADLSPRPPARFCAACGQETNLQAPTLREFAQQFGGAYFSTEGALWRTLKLLLLKPGELTARYLAGQRKHYVLPLRLYLTISVLVLLLMRVMGAGSVEVERDAAEQMAAENGNLTISVGPARLGLRDRVFFCDGLSPWLCARAKRRIDVDAQALPAEITGMKDRFLSNLGGAMFLLLPSFAAGLKLVYLNRRLRYTEHLVFALHAHSFWFLALALTATGLGFVSTLVAVALPLYGLKAMKRVYGGRWWPLLLRAAVVALLYVLALTVAMAGMALWVLLS